MEYYWGHSKRYNDYSSFIKKNFSERIQKVSVNAGFTCPNRDGSKGVGGCTFCNNNTFNPAYCKPQKSITEQIELGIRFFESKYKTQRYVAYFQAYSNTYDEIEVLKKKYLEALSVKGVIGLVIGTRPDCVSEELLTFLLDLKKRGYQITIEYGVESTNEETLLKINRGHTYQEGVDMVKKTKAVGILVGIHLILGLPGETRIDVLDHARKVSELPIDYLKIHQLQIVEGSELANSYKEDPDFVRLYSSDEYIDLCVDFLEQLAPNIIIDRFISQSPAELLIAPKWGLKNFEFVAKVEKRLKERETWQGRLYYK